MAESTSSSDGAGGRLTARDLALVAKEAVHELTGYPPESVSGLQWDGESWLVTVDVCELERVPSTTDVLATYVVQVDDRGGLLGYKRTRRFQRAQAEEG
jgi:Gas vesicle synthesis protein GvpO